MRHACLLLTTTMVVWGVVVTAARAADKEGVPAEKIPVDGPVTATVQPAYGNQAADPSEAMAAEDKPEAESGPKLMVDEPAPEKAPSEAKPAAEPAAAEKSPQEEPRPLVRRELTPALAALRDRVRRTMAVYFNQPLNTDSHHVADLLAACRAFGCQTEVIRNGQRVNAVTCLCWNYACGGFEPLAISEGRISGRVGYGRQGRPGQMLGVFALGRVPGNYPVRVGDDVRSMMDLVESEKRTCRSGADLSLKLMGLSFYVDDATWKNDLGEVWSIEKLIAEELDQPIVSAPEGGTLRLMALSAAVRDRARREKPLDGQYARAVTFVANYQKFALELQNADGTWHHEYFGARGPARDVIGQLAASGRISEWLAYSVDDDRLTDPRMVKAIESVTNLLNSQRYQGSTLRGLNSLELASVLHAVHALSLYDERVFKPADPPKAAAPAQPAAPAKSANGTRAAATK